MATNVHYKPLPMMTAYKELGWDISEFPNAYAYYENLITLPLHTKLSDEDVEYVIENFRDVVNDVIVAGSIGIYLGIVIWITLLCREPAYTCRVIMPFESYRKIYSGDYKSLVENIENIVMFFPLGYYLQMHFQKDWKQIAVKAFIFSQYRACTTYYNKRLF